METNFSAPTCGQRVWCGTNNTAEIALFKVVCVNILGPIRSSIEGKNIINKHLMESSAQEILDT